MKGVVGGGFLSKCSNVFIFKIRPLLSVETCVIPPLTKTIRQKFSVQSVKENPHLSFTELSFFERGKPTQNVVLVKRIDEAQKLKNGN